MISRVLRSGVVFVAVAAGLTSAVANGVKPISAVARPREINFMERSRITVTLDGNAPPGGAILFVVRSAATVLVAPNVVVVPAGRRSVTFWVLGINRSSTTRRVDLQVFNTSGSIRTYVLVRPAL